MDCENTTVLKDSALGSALRPCDEETKPENCPDANAAKNVTVTKCYCMGDYCNLSSNLHPLAALIMITVAIATVMSSKIFA